MIETILELLCYFVMCGDEEDDDEIEEEYVVNRSRRLEISTNSFIKILDAITLKLNLES